MALPGILSFDDATGVPVYVDIAKIYNFSYTLQHKVLIFSKYFAK